MHISSAVRSSVSIINYRIDYGELWSQPHPPDKNSTVQGKGKLTGLRNLDALNLPRLLFIETQHFIFAAAEKKRENVPA